MLARLFRLGTARRVAPNSAADDPPARIYRHIGPHTGFTGTRIFYVTLTGPDCSFVRIKEVIQHDLGRDHPREAAAAIAALRAHLMESPIDERFLVVKTAHYAGVFTLADHDDPRTLVVEL
jgi:hypothetical protein